MLHAASLEAPVGADAQVVPRSKPSELLWRPRVHEESISHSPKQTLNLTL